MNDRTDATGVNIFEQISQTCREFRKQILHGKPPRIEKYLTAISEDARETLFSNLLEIEINFRRSKGQTPTSEEYLKRFPQFAKQVRRAFFEPTLASYDSSVGGNGETQSLQVGGSSDVDTFAFEVPAANRLGRPTPQIAICFSDSQIRGQKTSN